MTVLVEHVGLERRAFLQLLLGAGGAVLASSVLGGWGKTAVFPHNLPHLFDHLTSATAVGLAYLRQHPHEAEVARLTDLVVADLPLPLVQLERLSRSELRVQLRAQIRADFAAEKTVKLQGWLVSLTEARLCGLAALIDH